MYCSVGVKGAGGKFKQTNKSLQRALHVPGPDTTDDAVPNETQLLHNANWNLHTLQCPLKKHLYLAEFLSYVHFKELKMTHQK